MIPAEFWLYEFRIQRNSLPSVRRNWKNPYNSAGIPLDTLIVNNHFKIKLLQTGFFVLEWTSLTICTMTCRIGCLKSTKTGSFWLIWTPSWEVKFRYVYMIHYIYIHRWHLGNFKFVCGAICDCKFTYDTYVTLAPEVSILHFTSSGSLNLDVTLIVPFYIYLCLCDVILSWSIHVTPIFSY